MTAFFFAPGSEIIFAIIGIGMVVWLFSSAVGGLFGGVNTSSKPIHVENERSANGKLMVMNAKYIENTGFYSAQIVDAETGNEVFLVVSRDKAEFDRDLKRQLEFWSTYPLKKE